MLKWLTLHTLITLTVVLSGCTQFYARQGNVDAQIDTWVENHQYDRALETIAALEPEHEQYAELRQRTGVIEAKRETYIEETLDEAQQFEREQEWAEAVKVLDRALFNLPDAPELRAQRQEYEERRLASVHESEQSILLARGRYLLAIRNSEENLLKASPDNFFAQQRYRRFQEDLKQVSRELYVVGKQSLYENDTPTAIQALSLSNRLAPNDLSQELLTSIQQAARADRTAARQEQAAVAERQWPVLESSFRQALQLNDLLGARRLVSEMKEINTEAAEPFDELLQERIDREANALLERGRLLYGQGFLQEALEVWQEALQLKPDDPELQASAQRAETFLKNLDRWGD